MKEKGFTLIEMMIVVAIIGILASIAIPTFSKMKQKSANTLALTDIKRGLTVIGVFLDNSSRPNTQPLFIGEGDILLTDGVITAAWSISPDVSAYYINGGSGSYCFAAKHLGGDTIYMASEHASRGIALHQLALVGVPLNAPGATPSQDCSGMTEAAIAAIAIK